jgi:lysophospholipase
MKNPFKLKPKFVAPPHEAAELCAFEGNPAPEGIVAKSLTTSDGKHIRYATVRTSVQPLKGTIVIFTGRNEAIEKYHETSANLLANGFDVVTFDWRGQGKSSALIPDAHKGYVRKFSDYRRDVQAMFEQVILPDCRSPFFILAHSTGALIALDSTPILKGKVDRMVLLAPFFGIAPRPLPTRAAGALAWFFVIIGLGRAYLGGGPRKTVPFASNRVTSDPARYARNTGLFDAYPILGRGAATARWVAESVATIRRLRVRGERPEYRIPSLILIAGKDRVVPRDELEDMARSLPAAHCRVIEGAQHEIMQERDIIREQALAAIYSFLPGTGPAGLRAGMATALDGN